jgi:secreted trypsin-like serine protease
MIADRLLGTTKMLGVTATLVACMGCTAEAGTEHTARTQQAITNGDDDDDDSAVVALLSGGKIFCTGVLVTPTVVLTAAHCVLPSAPEQVYFGAKPSSKKGRFIAVNGTLAHPEFDEDTLANDIAVVGLSEEATAAPLKVVRKDLDQSWIGREIRVVGFGAPSAAEIASLRKRTGVTTIESFTEDELRFKPSPSGTCIGDSGGPALVSYDDHEAIVGITSSGDAECKTYGRDMRVDRYLPFIQSYAKAYSLPVDPGAAENRGCTMSSRILGRSSTAAVLLLVMALVVAAARRRSL